MENSLITKNIQKNFNSFLKEFGFKNIKGIYIKEENDILQIISVKSINLNIYCDIAIQPLYILEESIILSLGNRINKFNCNIPLKSINSIEELDSQISLIKELISQNVLPWFNKYASAEGIIEFIEKEYSNNSSLIMGLSPYTKNLYLGFSYLYIKKYDIAISKFNLLLNEFEYDTRTWVINLKNRLNHILETINNNPNIIISILKNYIKETKSNLKI